MMEKRVIPHKSIWWHRMVLAYCAGKSYLFNMFFGWRASDEKGCTFVLSKRAWRALEVIMCEVR